MRGTRFGCRRPHLHAGIIPAYAGNTLTYVRSDKYSQDHPRVCGEHSYPLSTHASIMGSSPRMRGTPHLTELTDCVEGIIPAYAGNTRSTRQPARPERDHPRVCGEHRSDARLRHRQRGSSPRMRGTHGLNPFHIHRWRIIPAYAGNTDDEIADGGYRRDHPRVCGEHLASA